MVDSNCRIGATYVGSFADDLLSGLFGLKTERVKASECAVAEKAAIKTEQVDGGPDMAYKTIATLYTVIAGKK